MIVRRRHQSRYAVIPNAVAEDSRLSAAARGVLVWLLVKPDDWQIQIEAMRKEFALGRDKIRAIMNELIEAGYARRQQSRDEGGKLGAMDYEIHDVVLPADPEPQALEQAETEASPAPEKPSAVEQPQTDSPSPDLPSPANTSTAIYKDSPSTQSNQIPREQTLQARAREREDFDPKVREKGFKRFAPTWPTWLSSSEPAARKAWFALSDAECEAAEARAPDYVAGVKAEGRSMICTLQIYLAEKRWKRLPEKQAEPKRPERIAAYGKAWMAYRLWLLETFKPVQHPPAKRLLQALPTGGYVEIDPAREKSWRYPFIEALDHGHGALMAPDHVIPPHDGYVQIRVGSEAWQAWQAWHEERGWPWFEAPQFIEFVWVPAKRPEEM